MNIGGEKMDIVIGVITIATLVMIIGLSAYVTLKKQTKDVIISESIVYFFKDKSEDNLDELIKFSKLNNSEYKI